MAESKSCKDLSSVKKIRLLYEFGPKAADPWIAFLHSRGNASAPPREGNCNSITARLSTSLVSISLATAHVPRVRSPSGLRIPDVPVENNAAPVLGFEDPASRLVNEC